MLSKTNAAFEILRESKKPMTPREIIKMALGRGMIKTRGKTPDATLAVDLLLETRRRASRGAPQRFVRVGPALWGLTEW